MKFELNDVLVGRIIGISMAAAVAVTVAIASEIIDIKHDATAITENNSAMAGNHADERSGSTTIVPFVERNTTVAVGNSSDEKYNSSSLKDIYDELAKSKTFPEITMPGNETATIITTTTTTTATTSTTAPSGTSDNITNPTTAETKRAEAETTTATTEPAVSNGKREFNYDDVSLIAADLKTLGDFVDQLNPTSFCWDASEYESNGYVKISLISSYGNVTLDVKPVAAYIGNGQYKIDDKVSGSVSGSSITEWNWYIQNKDGGCNICSVTWAAEEFAIAPVRNIKLGTSLAGVTENYLCVNGGASTLYKASDVIKEQNKLNALLAVENEYTFVGGRVYTIDSYLEKYYHGKENSYRFADCNYVVQYGCNSIMDYNYVTGSWIIEYAIKDDVVVGITFMNKSFYNASNTQTSAQATATDNTISTTSTTSSTTAF